jgi:hypothetical protein
VVYHEFLETGFRRNVHLAFIENDSRIVFEREGGLGIYETDFRTSLKLPLEGSVAALDETGGGGLFFVITARGERQKNLVAIRFPGTVIINTPFTSETVFLRRYNSRLFIGGGITMAAFDLDKK